MTARTSTANVVTFTPPMDAEPPLESSSGCHHKVRLQVHQTTLGAEIPEDREVDAREHRVERSSRCPRTPASPDCAPLRQRARAEADERQSQIGRQRQLRMQAARNPTCFSRRPLMTENRYRPVVPR